MDDERGTLGPMARVPDTIDVTLSVDTTQFDQAMDALRKTIDTTFARRFAPTWDSMEASDLVMLASLRGWRKRVVLLRLWRLRCNRRLAERFG